MCKRLKVIRTYVSTITRTGLILCIGMIISGCENNEIDPSEHKSTLDNSKAIANSCDDSFPGLGPSASSSQTCPDVSNPINIGRLDCRTSDSYGGYANDGSWGEYKIIGGATRYDGTRTRVERFFNDLKRERNKKTILTGTIRIVDLSDGNTCVIQSHAGGKIVKGRERGSTNESAQFLVYAKKDGSRVKLETHITDDPYTTTSGGGRKILFFRHVNFRQNYTFTYETGYNSRNIAYSRLRIGGTEKTFIHNHTTERVYTRYGAYGTSDTGDKTAHIRFQNINHCR